MKGLTLITALLTFSMAGCTKNSVNPEPVAQSGSPESVSTTEKNKEDFDSAVDKEEYMKQCMDFDYKEYFRYEDKYRGSKVKATVQVAQILENDVFRCYTLDEEGFPINEYLIQDKRKGDNFRILVDDIVMVWGEYIGSSQIERAIGEMEEDIFTINANYIELVDDVDSNKDDFQEYLGNAKADSYFEEDRNNYILSSSDTAILTEADLSGLTGADLKIAKNEIYARHGRKFKDTTLQDYFNSKNWYSGMVEPEQFDENVLSHIEKSNIQTISSYMDTLDKGSQTFDIARVSDKSYINGSSEDCYEVYFYVEDGQIYFTISRYDSNILRGCNAQIVNNNTLKFSSKELQWDLNFIWNGDGTFKVTGQGEELQDMIESEFYDTSAFLNAS